MLVSIVPLHPSSQQSWNAGRLDCQHNFLVCHPKPRGTHRVLDYPLPLDRRLSEATNACGSEANSAGRYISSSTPIVAVELLLAALFLRWGPAHSFKRHSILLHLSRRHLLRRPFVVLSRIRFQQLHLHPATTWQQTTVFLCSPSLAHTLSFDTSPRLSAIETQRHLVSGISLLSPGQDSSPKHREAKTGRPSLCLASCCSTTSVQGNPGGYTCPKTHRPLSIPFASEAGYISTARPPRHEPPTWEDAERHRLTVSHPRPAASGPEAPDRRPDRTSRTLHQVFSVHKDHPCPTLRAP